MLVKRKGQSVLEYVIVLTVIIAAILLFANGVLKNNVQNALGHASGQMENAVNKITF